MIKSIITYNKIGKKVDYQSGTENLVKNKKRENFYDKITDIVMNFRKGV